MDAIEALTTRISAGPLVEPAPDDAALRAILAAAMRAPDHGRLRPWRFVIIRGAARAKLGELLAQSLHRRLPDMEAAQLEREKLKPLRAPLIIAVCACIHHTGRIPHIEQVLSAGAAAENIMLAAHALGYGCAWKTGDAAYDPHVKAALGLAGEDAIVGFLYLGTHGKPPGAPAVLDAADYVVEWSGAQQGSSAASSREGRQ